MQRAVSQGEEIIIVVRCNLPLCNNVCLAEVKKKNDPPSAVAAVPADIAFAQRLARRKLQQSEEQAAHAIHLEKVGHTLAPATFSASTERDAAKSKVEHRGREQTGSGEVLLRY